MATFQFKVTYVMHNGPDGDGQYYAYFTKAQLRALTWLLSNVGGYKVAPKYFEETSTANVEPQTAYLLPLEGHGWRIAEGFRYDRPVDVHLNNFDDDVHPSGPYGDWLCIEDDNIAMRFARMGFFDNAQTLL